MIERTYDTFEDWYRARHDGVGASELAGILGLSRFHSPWSIWQRKVDRPEPGPRWGSKEAEAGHRHEETIARWFHEVARDSDLEEGFSVEDPGDFATSLAESMIPMFATPDRFICQGDQRLAVLELKCAWYAQAKRFTKGFPLEYRTQVQAQLLCTGLQVGYYAVLLNGMELKWYREERNEKFLKVATEKVKRFRQHVTDRIPPPADFSEATSRAIAVHYREPTDDAVDLPDELATAPIELDAIKAKIKDLSRHKIGLENKVKAAMGNATLGRLPDGMDFTWRPDVRGRRTLRTKVREDDRPREEVAG